MAWLLAHRRSLLFLLALFALGGMVTALRLPVALFPTLDFPRVVVNVDAGDRPVDRMAVEVTQPLEQALRAVPDARAIRSTTSRGSADLALTFEWGTDMVTALLQVQAVVSQILPDLPAGVRFTARRMDPTVFPVLGLALTSVRNDPVALRDFAFYRLRPLLSALPGVAEVQVLGGRQAEYQVMVDPDRLHDLGLTLAEVASALSDANVVSAVGKMEEHYHLYLTLADSHQGSEEDILHSILRSGLDGVVELEDVGRVERGHRPEWTKVSANGKDAVLVNILQQRGANTVAIAEETRRALAGFSSQIPGDIEFKPYYDQSELVNDAAVSVRDALASGAVLAALILLLFLRNLRVTLIMLIVVPGVISATVWLLKLFGQSFNIMTLGGLAAAVGLVTDDAVVMIEHIMRRLSETRDDQSTHGTVMTAAREMLHPLTASSLATIVVFFPLPFLGGITGGFFRALALTMASALVISYGVAALAVPLLANHLLSRRDALRLESVGPSQARFHRAYGSLLHCFLRQPLWTLPVIIALVVTGVVAFSRVGSGFMPHMDEGGFVLDYRAPPGTSLTETDRLLDQVERIIATIQDIDSYSRRTGLSLGGHITEANEGDFFIHLKPRPRRGVEDVMTELREAIESCVPGLQIETAQLMEDLLGDITAVPQPIEIKLFGDDSQVLRQFSPQVAALLDDVPGVVEVFDGITLAGDAIEIHFDPVQTALEGVSPGMVARQIQDFLAGTVATQITTGPKMIGVRVWTNEALRTRLGQLEALRIRSPDGHDFPLKRVAHLQVIEGQAQETRENLKAMVAVTARIEGRDLGSTVADVQTRVATLPLPPGVYVEYGGLYREQQDSFRGLILVFISAVLLVALLLLFFYERIRVVLAILTTTSLSLTGVFAGLWLTGTELNISSLMGMTLIVGIVTEVAVFYFSELRQVGNPDPPALVRAGILRMRPIFMTSLVAILALMPLALGMGPGSAMQKPLAIAIISGLLLAVPLVLIVMPAIYALFHTNRWGIHEP